MCRRGFFLVVFLLRRCPIRARHALLPRRDARRHSPSTLFRGFEIPLVERARGEREAEERPSRGTHSFRRASNLGAIAFPVTMRSLELPALSSRRCVASFHALLVATGGERGRSASLRAHALERLTLAFSKSTDEERVAWCRETLSNWPLTFCD